MDSIQPYNQVYRRKVKNLEESVGVMDIDCQKLGLFAPVTPAKLNNVYVRRRIRRLESIVESSKFVTQCLGSFDGVEMEEMEKKEFLQHTNLAKPSNVHTRRKVQGLENKIENSKQCLAGDFLSSDDAIMEELRELSKFAEDDLSVKCIEDVFGRDDGSKGENGFRSCGEANLEGIDWSVPKGLHKAKIYNGKDIMETTHGKKGVLEEGLGLNPSFGDLGQQICDDEFCSSTDDIVDSIYTERNLNKTLEDTTDNGLEWSGELRQHICGEEGLLDQRLENETDNVSKGCIESGEQLYGGEDILGKDNKKQRLEDDRDGVVKCCVELGERIFHGERELFDSNKLRDLHKNEISVGECNNNEMLDSYSCTPNICILNSQFQHDNNVRRSDSDMQSPLPIQKNISNLGNHKNQMDAAELNAFTSEYVQNHEEAPQKDQLQGNNSFAPSTPLHTQNSNKRRKVDIDLNKKLRPKSRKKHHTPKIVADGKPKRTPKSKIPRTPSRKISTGKRKYVKKTKIESSMPVSGDFSTPKEAHHITKDEDEVIVMKDDAKVQLKQKTSKRQLNFNNGNLLDAIFAPLDSHACKPLSNVLIERCPMKPDQGTKEVLFHQLPFTGCFPSEFKKKRSQRKKRAIIKLFMRSGKRYKIRYVLLVYFPKTFKKKRSRKSSIFGRRRETVNENPLINTFDVVQSFNKALDCSIIPTCHPNLTSPFSEQKESKFLDDLGAMACAETISTSNALINRKGLDTFHCVDGRKILEFGVPSLLRFDAQNNGSIRNQLEFEQKLDTELIGQGKESPLEEIQHLVSKPVDMQLMVVPQNITPVAEEGAIIPYKSANKVKAPKVELDSVTMAEWHRLLLNDGCGLDYDQEKKWEEDRKVFRGRVDSFIARMHLILGDRRFTPWRGSVVDSVVGVFLTQNVSDNLSSSAFMSLAAKFPLKSQNTFTGDVDSTNSHKLKTEEESHSKNLGDAKVAEFPMTSGDGLVANLDDKKCIDTSLSSTHPFNLGSCMTFANKYEVSSWKEYAPSINNCIELGVVNNETSIGDTQVGENSNCIDKMVERQKIALNPISDGIRKEMEKETTSLRDQQQIFSQKHRKEKVVQKKSDPTQWEHLRESYTTYGPRCFEHTDSVNWEAVRCANVVEIAETIKERGQHNLIAARIQELLNKLVMQQNSIDLEWLRNCPPDKAKQYLLEINGLGLKSVECVRLLTLQHIAFPVDTNVGRIAVRLGWVPLQPLPEEVQFHLLERYPIMDDIQKYLWPRLCTLEQRTLYELHYQLITFGKVFCTKKKPNCNACPMRGECRHFASAFASAKLALPAPASDYTGPLVVYGESYENPHFTSNISWPLLPAVGTSSKYTHATSYVEREPIIEEPDSPGPEFNNTMEIMDIEDCYLDNDEDEVPTIMLHSKKYMENSWSCGNGDGKISEEISKALIVLPPEVASIPLPKLKRIERLRTEHQVYELPDDHPLLESFERRELEDPSHYLLAMWGTDNIELAPKHNNSELRREVPAEATSLQNGTTPAEDSETIRGTILIPCRTAMRSRFPLNGTYFQVNEVFADYKSSCCPINVHRDLIWNLPRRTVYFGTTTSNILRGLPMEKIQQCFLRGFVCVRAFDRKTGSPRPLAERFHKLGYKAGKRAVAANDD